MENAPRYLFLSLLVLVVGGLIALGIVNRGNKLPDPPLQGAGSSFVHPLMVQWSSQHEKNEDGFRIGYRSVGSGSGIKLFIGNKIDFACSDAPLTEQQIEKVRDTGTNVVHIPLVLGAVVPVYNLAEIQEPLHFTGPVLADIYMGKVNKWNDKALAELNPKVKLPDREIVAVHRADSSGTTHIWADYLSKVSSDWKKNVGVGTDLKWPVGVGEDGNQGVAEKVLKTPGAIGYVELTYAFQLDLAMGLVQNREKEFVKATLTSVGKAADNALVDIPDDLRFSLTDAPGKGSYPIAGVTWAIVRVNPPHHKGRLLADFLTWGTTEGQSAAQGLLYVKLPDALAARARNKIAEIKVD